MKRWVPPKNATRSVWMAWYRRYLKSERWAAIRKRRMALDGWRCVLCGSETSLQVHHLTYEMVGREELDDLRTTCEPCHKDLHERADELRAQEGRPTRKANTKRAPAMPFTQDLKTRRRPKPEPTAELLAWRSLPSDGFGTRKPKR